MIVEIATAPDGAIAYTRDTDIVAIDVPFAWGGQIQARAVRLRNGDRLMALDTPDNLTRVLAALSGAGASVQATVEPNTGDTNGQ